VRTSFTIPLFLANESNICIAKSSDPSIPAKSKATTEPPFYQKLYV
jgi:hypothetical protein